jgi:ribonuclease BN (tRNA processing enzyme)
LEHHPTSIGYRFHTDGRTIAVTGDTRWCSGLEELSRGSDLLIVECSSVERQTYAHVSLEELREGVGRLGAGRIALVHLDDAVARALRDTPIPGVTAMQDGDFLEL